MSNKDWKNINELDKIIQRTLNMGMADNGTYLTIEYIWGFELFNTRPYHNYETWSGGYRLSDYKNKIRVEMEDLDDAVKEWARLVAEKKAERPIPRHNDLDLVSKRVVESNKVAWMEGNFAAMAAVMKVIDDKLQSLYPDKEGIQALEAVKARIKEL